MAYPHHGSGGDERMIRRCSRCLLPHTYPGVSFDEQGVCNHCRDYRKPESLGEAVLREKLASKPGAEYDCVIGISGGKDSCYVAYLAKEKLGLTPLAVCYDFPFMVDLARQNARSVCDSLGIELLVVKSKHNVEYEFVRNHLRSLAPTGTTWGQCVFCHYGIKAILHEVAEKHGAPFILSGVTSSEVWWDPGSRLGILGKRLGALGAGDKARFGLHQCKAYLNLVDQRRQFPLPGSNALDVYRRARTREGGPETIKVFDYIEWNHAEIETVLAEKTGWKKPDRALSWRYDCILEPLLDFTYLREFGISSAGLYLCGLIRAGIIGREEALELLEASEDTAMLDKHFKFVLDFLELPQDVQCGYVGGLRGERE